MKIVNKLYIKMNKDLACI